VSLLPLSLSLSFSVYEHDCVCFEGVNGRQWLHVSKKEKLAKEKEVR